MRTCIHLLPDTGRTAENHGKCCGQGVAALFGCAMHGETTLAKKLNGYRSCVGCTDFAAKEEQAVADYRWLIPGIEDPLPTPLINPREWWKLTQFEERDKHFEALKKIASADLPTPKGEGCGIIYVGGDGNGSRSSEYGLQVAVGIRMARRVGWLGPIEWWHDSRRERVRHYLTPDMGDVRIRDFAEFGLRYSVGWWTKIPAIAMSGFARAIFLDADAYLSDHPDHLFTELEESDFIYWAKDDKWAIDAWVCPGINSGGRNGVQGGQLAINRLKAWRLVLMAAWMCQHGDFYGAEKKHKKNDWRMFGDEDAWPISMAILQSVGNPARAKSLGVVTPTAELCNFRLRGKPCVVHLCNDKMHSSGYRPRLTYADKITEACEEMEEAIRARERNAVGAPPGWRYRKLTWDLKIFAQVARDNEYELTDLGGKTVLDVGGNTGCFTWLAHQYGAGRIVSVEPHPDNFVILDWNCKAYAECHELALWGESGGEFLTLEDHAHGNTGTAKLGTSGVPVKVERFDAFVERTFGDGVIDLMKLDCEGAEIPILLTSQRLGQFREIRCEIHAGKGAWDAVTGEVTERLRAFGFEITKCVCHWLDAGQGHLFAKRG